MDLRKLDTLVAEKVMGWNQLEHMGLKRIIWKPGYSDDVAWFNDPPRYSTDIAAAWEVFEASEKEWRMDIISRDSDNRDGWIVGSYDPDRVISKGRTAPLAICLAALKAKGVDVSEWEGK